MIDISDDVRRRLHDFAATTVVDPDAWDKIQQRLAAPRRRRAAARRPMAAAVAVAIVAVVAALGLVARDDGSVVDTIRGTTTTTDRDADRTTTTTNPRSSTTTSPGSEVPGGIDPPRGSGGETGASRGQAGQTGSGQPGPRSAGPPISSPDTTAPEPSPAPRYEATISPTVVAPGETVTAESVARCTPSDDDTWGMHMYAEVRYDGVQVDAMHPWWPGPPGEWVWTFVTTADQAPGLYTVRFSCHEEFIHTQGIHLVFEYELLSFTVQAP